MKAKLLVLSMVIAGVSGCGSTGWKSDYACPGMPNGVICKSPIEVYKLTENTDRVLTVSNDAEHTQQTGDAPKGKAASLLPEKVITAKTQPREALPVLEPARVMRVWIAPWIDAKQDLHMPGYVFTEVTPRRWSFGEPTALAGKPLVPLQSDLRAAEADSPDIGEGARTLTPRTLVQGMQQEKTQGAPNGAGSAAALLLPAAAGAIQGVLGSQ